MNYIGISYGTFLGATYANLLPHRIRALVLDGVVYPPGLGQRRGLHRRQQVLGYLATQPR